MTYAVGQTIAAADYMGFRGAAAPNVAYPSSLAATNAVAALIGVGYGSRGYGQTSTVIPAVTTGSVIAAAEWNNLYAAMANINTQTGSGLTLPANVSTGQVIQAQDGTSGRPNLPTLISTLDSNRLTAAISQVAVSSELTSVRTTSWTTSVTHQFTMTFASEDTARYFFNTGGNAYLSGSRTGGSATHINQSMTDLLAQMGTIKVGATATTYTGSGGTAYPIGYYGLTGSFQTLFTHYGSTYGYTTISYTVQAKVTGVVGSNGGNGNVVTVQAIFATQLSGPQDVLDGTLTSTIQQLKADVLTVTAPTWATTISL